MCGAENFLFYIMIEASVGKESRFANLIFTGTQLNQVKFELELNWVFDTFHLAECLTVSSVKSGYSECEEQGTAVVVKTFHVLKAFE